VADADAGIRPGTTPVTQPGVVFSAGLTTLFDNEQLLVDTGTNQETITITCGHSRAYTRRLYEHMDCRPFYNTHNNLLAGVPISAPGAFSTGIVPPAAGVTLATRVTQTACQ